MIAAATGAIRGGAGAMTMTISLHTKCAARVAAASTWPPRAQPFPGALLSPRLARIRAFGPQTGIATMANMTPNTVFAIAERIVRIAAYEPRALWTRAMRTRAATAAQTPATTRTTAGVTTASRVQTTVCVAAELTVPTAALGPAPARAAQIVTGRPAITGSRRASRAYRWNSTTAVIARRARARALVPVQVAARVATATHAITGS